MENLFTFGDYSLSQINFWLYTVVGFVLGGIFYGVASHRSTRRAPFREWPAVPKPISILVGVVISLLFVHWAHQTNWLVFYELEAQDDELSLRYFYPEQTVTLPCSEIESMDVGRGIDGLHLAMALKGYRLVIHTTEGGTFRSAGEPSRTPIETLIEELCVEEE